MADVTAAMVKALRLKTDAPLLECKKALAESDGHLEKAEELLRVRLGNRAVKASGRVAAEGIVLSYLTDNPQAAVLLEINCETDFVCKNEGFVAFAQAVVAVIARDKPRDVEALAGLDMQGVSVEAARVALVGRMGENITIRRFVIWESSVHRFSSYVHGTRSGVLVDYEGDASVARDVAMHIVASRPLCVRREDVSPDVLQKEREIYQQQALQSGKPANIISKMVEGRVSKFLSEVTLLDQPFVKNPDQTVGALLAASQTTIHRFQLFIVGEGIEKAVVDFAQEVAAVARH